MNWLLSLLSWLRAAITFAGRRLLSFRPSSEQAPFRYVAVDEFPDTLGTLKVYLAGEGVNLWAASMICPCGCGETIQLNLLKAARPCWEAEPHPDGTISLSPSISRRKGCKSHFWIRRGHVDWC